MTQFVNAFDEAIINRYTKERDVVDRLAVRYVYAPKQRVLHDLINKAQHITLPCVAITISSVDRDPSRVQNKIFGSRFTMSSAISATHSGILPQPVPVDIAVNMSIITRYQTDMDQILSNFVPYCDPYITISWKRQGLESNEIRSNVHWSGHLGLDYPIDLNAAQPARVTCDTTFVIKGWLFKHDATPVGYIFNIDTNFTAVKQIEDLDTMLALRSPENTDERGIIGRPQISFADPYVMVIDGPNNEFNIFGKMFAYTTGVYVSAGNIFHFLVHLYPQHFLHLVVYPQCSILHQRILSRLTFQPLQVQVLLILLL
jgi:T4-like virus Myoviridae tail sheath stabiliser